MRRFGRLGSAALIGPALLLIAACGNSVVAPASSPPLVTVPTAGSGGTPLSTSTGTDTATTSTASGSGVSASQLNQIDNQISQIDNEVDQANQALATSEGDPTK